MANLNKVMLIGRLTRDPEEITGGKGTKFGFAVNNRKLNATTQQWEDVPVFLDVEIWNRGETGRQASLALQSLRKGNQVFLEGHLKMDQWEDKNGGGKRSKLVVVVENFQFLEPNTRGENGGSEPMARAPRAAAAPSRPAPAPAFSRSNDNYDDEPDVGSPGRRTGGGGGGTEDEIPF